MALNSTLSIPQVVDPAIVSAFDEVKNQITQELQYKKFPFKTYQIETTADKMTSLSGYGAGGLTIQGQIYATDNKYNGYDKTMVVRKYTKNAPYTEELDYFLKKRSSTGVFQVDSMVRGLVDGLFLNWEQDFAKTFYLGQGTTFLTGGDSLALLSASHPARKGGVAVQSNLATLGAVTNPVLNADTLKAAMIQLDRFKDNAGVLVKPVTNLCLVASRQLLETAFRLKMSEFGPDTANLGYGQVSPTILAQIGKSFKVLPLHHMPDAYSNYWFVVDLDKMKEMLVMAYAWEPRLNEQLKDVNGVTNIMASTLFGPNPIDWRWLVGSTGANPVA
jgi:hypothetical protein